MFLEPRQDNLQFLFLFSFIKLKNYWLSDGALQFSKFVGFFHRYKVSKWIEYERSWQGVHAVTLSAARDASNALYMSKMNPS